MAKLLCEKILSSACKLVTGNGLANQLLLQRCGIQTTASLDFKHRYFFDNIDTAQYKETLKKQRLYKSGGRDPVTGRITQNRVGGGHKQCLRLVSYNYNVSEDKKGIGYERVLKVCYDPVRTADIAIAATGNKKRFILASENMKAGDLIKTHPDIPQFVVNPVVGHKYPVGSLPIGTLLHNIERWPGYGGMVARAAGSAGMLIKKLGDGTVIIRMPSKREMTVNEYAMVTVGRVSNAEKASQPIGSAGRSRWFGIRPKSGLKQKKKGYHGKKIKPIKQRIDFTQITPPSSSSVYKIDHD